MIFVACKIKPVSSPLKYQKAQDLAMAEVAISVKNLSKCYCIYDSPRDRLKQLVLPKFKRMLGETPQQYYKEFWALTDVSFEIKKGETVGIIGRNGSGKSTLLQTICGTLYPTSGSVETNGRIAALLELGSGFNPAFTGRENVYMNAAVLGLTKDEVDARFDDIAAFADIGKFIEQPVKTYSSGMYVRLAFAVNILSSPDIMIVDEALAVGDMAFQAKCMTALARIQNSGATVLFVSHDISALRSLCSQGVYLESGTIKAIGKASEVADLYVRSTREKMNSEYLKFAQVQPTPDMVNVAVEDQTMQSVDECDLPLKRSDEFNQRVSEFRYGTGGVKVTYVELLNMDDEPIQLVAFNQEVKVRIYAESLIAQNVSVNFHILDDKKINLTGCSFLQVAQDLLSTQTGDQYLLEYKLRLPLQEGSYSLRAQITSPIVQGETAEFVDVIENAVVFQVERWNGARVWSKVHLFPSFQIKKLSNHESIL